MKKVELKKWIPIVLILALLAGNVTLAVLLRQKDVQLDSIQAQLSAMPEESTVQLRVYDGEMQWSDGMYWYTYDSAAKLAAMDPFVLAQQNAPEQNALQAPSCGRQSGSVNIYVAPKATPVPAGGSAGGETSSGGENAPTQPSGGDSGAGETPAQPSGGDGGDMQFSDDIL